MEELHGESSGRHLGVKKLGTKSESRTAGYNPPPPKTGGVNNATPAQKAKAPEPSARIWCNVQENRHWEY
jgi:hypothetical protein